MYWSDAMSTCNFSGFGDDTAFQENFHKASYLLGEHKGRACNYLAKGSENVLTVSHLREGSKGLAVGAEFFLRVHWLKRVERRDCIQVDHEFWEDKGNTSSWENKIIKVKKEHVVLQQFLMSSASWTWSCFSLYFSLEARHFKSNS